MDDDSPLTNRDRHRPPTPSTRDSQEVLFGNTHPDPYRSLENFNSDPTLEWLNEERCFRDRIFGELSTQLVNDAERIASLVRELSNLEWRGLPLKAKGKYYFCHTAPDDCEKRSSHAEDSVPMVCQEFGGVGSPLFRTSNVLPGFQPQVCMFSPDANSLAVEWYSKEKESTFLGVVRLNPEPESVDLFECPKASILEWSNTGSGFWYFILDEAPDTTRPHKRLRVWFHHVDGSSVKDPLICTRVFRNDWTAQVQVHLPSEVLALYLAPQVGCLKPQSENYLWSLREQEGWYAVPLPHDGFHHVIGVADGEAVVATDYEAPDLRVVGLSIGSGRTHLREIVPAQPGSRIQQANLLGIYLVLERGDPPRSLVFSLDGKFLTTLDEVSGGKNKWRWNGCEESPELFVRHEKRCRPPAIFSCTMNNVGEAKVALAWQPSLTTPLSPTTMRTHYFCSRDGTEVPAIVLTSANSRPPQPVLVEVYAAHDLPTDLEFNPAAAAWIEMGGLYVIPLLRGGGITRAWSAAGRKANKENSVQDIMACIAWIKNEGFASPGKVALYGASAGGFTIASLLARDPESVDACCICNAMTDLLGYPRYQEFHLNVREEWGDPFSEDDYSHLRKLSPYHNLPRGGNYPFSLFMIGLADSRVHPAQTLKFAAAVKASQLSGAPIVIDTSPDDGHWYGNTASDQARWVRALWVWLHRESGRNSTQVQS